MIWLITYFFCTRLHNSSLPFIIFSISQFWIPKYLLKQWLETSKNNLDFRFSVLHCEVDLVNLLSTSFNWSLDSQLPYSSFVFHFPRYFASYWVRLIGEFTLWIVTGVSSMNTWLLSVLHFLVQNSISHHPVSLGNIVSHWVRYCL